MNQQSRNLAEKAQQALNMVVDYLQACLLEVNRNEDNLLKEIEKLKEEVKKLKPAEEVKESVLTS
jgi:peptidoglycan hydrolase CwlO-like protein